MATFRISFFLLFLGFCCVQLHAQTKPVKNYKLFFEKVYLHTDRELYAAGNDIWFKAYMVNGQNNLPIGISNNLYVELISPQAEIIKREIVRIDYGIGSGDIKLDSVATGKYRLRAYTNWMRNFGDNFVFEKEINIINVDPKKQAKKLAPVFLTNITTVRFFPEGGSLIEDVSSLIAVKAVNIKGKGISVSGSVLNNTGDTITKFTTDSLGMGLFALLPLKGQKYHATFNSKINIADVVITNPLTIGLSLAIIERDTLVDVIINTNKASLSVYNDRIFTIIGKHSGVLCFRQPLNLSGNQTLMRVPKTFFPEGITNFLIYDERNKPYTERLFYVEHPENNTNLNIITDKAAYGPRGKVEIKLKLTDSVSKASLSMSVIDENVVPVPLQNIRSYLMLTSELKGNIEQPLRYFDTTNVNRKKQLNMLLLTQGWRDFLWKRIADTAIKLSYIAENGFNVTGNLRKKLNKSPIIGMNITLTAFGAKGQKLFSTKTDSLGRYYFGSLELYGPQTIGLTARDNVGNRSGWLLMDSLTNKPPIVSSIVQETTDTSKYSIRSLKKREDEQKIIIKINMLKEVKVTDNKTVVLREVSASKFGYIDQVFNITKKDEYYEAFDNWMAHNLKGAIINDEPGVLFRGVQGPSYLKGLMYPRFIINGEELFIPDPDGDPERYEEDVKMGNNIRKPYFDLTMDKIKRVELKHFVGQKRYTGAMTDVYLLYLNIVPGAFESKDFGMEKAQVAGYYEARVFYKPLYDIPTDSKDADLRTTIHWEPNITTDANGEATVSYYNADPKSKIRVVVEGLTTKGVPIATTTGYTIK